MMNYDRALIIKKHWLDMIFDEKKTWEIRGHDTKVRGKIGLIESGSGTIAGECWINGSFEVFDRDSTLECLHGIEDWSHVKYKKPHAWVISNPVRYEKPIPYKHPRGAVIWVKV
jgi:hypothetical protein